MSQTQEVSNMTFRKMTFLFISFILSLLFVLQLALIQTYSKDVSSKIGEAAFQVSRSTVEKLLFGQPSNQVKAFAFSTRISRIEREMMVQSISNISNDINISLNDGQKDKFIAINSGGTKLLVDIPRTGITDSLDSMLEKLLISSLAFIFIGVLVANYFAKKLAQPLKELEKASYNVGKGEFGFQIKNNHLFQSVEIKNAVNAFNNMSKQILNLRKENEALQKQAQHSELTEITRGLAHTIRNPLNTLNLAIDELVTTSDKRLKTKLNNISKKQIQRIDKWVRSMMDIMASEKNITESVDLTQLLKFCVDDRVLIEAQNIKIGLVIDGENKYFMRANEVELKSLINGLVSNAIEASRSIENAENGDHYLVEIALSKIASEGETNNKYQISILDRGIGISKEIMSKLFSPHNTNKTYGAGMGLYLAHRVITLKYQGDISITNNPESTNMSTPGTKIVLTLQDRV